VDDFFRAYPSRTYKRGEVIVFADGTIPAISYLEHGIVGQYDVAEDGTRAMVNLFKPPAFFPMSATLNATPNRYFFEALTDTTGRQAPGEVVARWLEEQPEIMLDLLRRVYRGTDGILGRMSLLMSGTAHSRIMNELWIMVERFGEPLPNGRLRLRLTETQLAQQTGLARETISRELTALKRTGALQHAPGGGVLVDPEKLAQKTIA
jgi:CRP-like cAMP-binding protein